MSAFKFSPIEKKSASVKVTHASANAWCLEYCLFQTSRTVCVAPPASGAGRFQSVGGRKIGGSAGVGKIAATGRTAGNPRGWRAEGATNPIAGDHKHISTNAGNYPSRVFQNSMTRCRIFGSRYLFQEVRLETSCRMPTSLLKTVDPKAKTSNVFFLIFGRPEAWRNVAG